MITAEEIIRMKNKKYVSVSPETPISEAIKIMVENKVGATLAIVIESDENICGIWTERDLMRNILVENFNPHQSVIEDYMVKDLYFAEFTDTIETLIQKLVRHRVRHLLVKKNEKMIGLLSNEDILNACLDEKEKEYNRLFENVGCGVYISSRVGKFLNVNQALLDMLGYENKDDFLQKDIGHDIYYRMEDRKIFQEKVEQEKRVIDYEVAFKKKNGEPITVLLTCHLRYDFDGNIAGYEGIIVDLTQRKLMEQQLFNTQMQLLKSEKLAAMGKLSSQIAHEMNNPMFGIMNTLELLKTEIPPGNRRRKMLEMSISEINRLSEMLKKMLSFSPQSQDNKKIINVNTIVEEIILYAQDQMKDLAIKYDLTLEENISKIIGFKNQIRQVVNEIVTNSMEAMPDGGKLHIKTVSNENLVIIEITDTGRGIKPENIDKIFESFYTTKSSVFGVGLGLSASYGYVKDHGGEIKVESTENKGSKFTIELPAATDAD